MAWNLKNSATFCHYTEVKPWKIWFSLENQVPLPSFCNFAIFGPHFHQLFATDIRWSLEKFDFLRKISFRFRFLPILKNWLKRGQILETFCQNTKVKPWKFKFLSLPVEKSTSVSCFSCFSIFRPHFHQLFATDIRCTKKNLEKKQLTSVSGRTIY